MMMRDTLSLSDRVRDELVRMIRDDEFQGNRLPAESKLASRLGVSVAVVREALLLMREDGIITKKHGSGNYIHRSALTSGARINQYPGFRQLLSQFGYSVDEDLVTLEFLVPDERICGILHLKDGERAVYYKRIIRADGEPAIYCQNWLPEKLFDIKPDSDNMQNNIFDVFRMLMHREFAYSQMQFIPHLCDEEDKELLHVEIGTPTIILEQTFFSLEDEPMAFGHNEFNSKYITVNMLSR